MAKRKKTNRGGNPGRATNGRAKSLVPLSVRVSEENKDWLTRHSEMAGISRAGYLDKLLSSIRQTETNLGQAGIFDAYQNEIDRVVEQTAKNLRGRRE